MDPPAPTHTIPANSGKYPLAHLYIAAMSLSTKGFFLENPWKLNRDLVGLDFIDDGNRYTITGTSDNDGDLTLTYIDPQKPLANGTQHESAVKEVRKWYNKATMIQAINSIVPTRSTFVNDLAFESYQQVKEYDLKLHNPLNHIALKSCKQAGNRESQRFSTEDKKRDGIIDFNT